MYVSKVLSPPNMGIEEKEGKRYGGGRVLITTTYYDNKITQFWGQSVQQNKYIVVKNC